MKRLGIALSLILFSTACTRAPLEPTRGDRVPEVSMSGERLRAAFTFDNGYLLSDRLDTPELATTVGLMVDVKPSAVDARVLFEARGLRSDGAFTEWVQAELTWNEGIIRVLRADLGTAVDSVQIRIAATDAAAVDFVTWAAVVPVPVTLQRNVVKIATKRSALSADLAAFGVTDRATWGARATRCTSQNATKTLMAVHHTVTPIDSAGSFSARIRGIQSFHMDTRGWCDIGYHFMVTTDGGLWEARPVNLIGAHVSGHNTNNIGVSFVGCFHNDATCQQAGWGPTTPPAAMLQRAGELIGFLGARYGITVDTANVKGHRDHSGASTSCPGDNLHSELGTLRTIANDGTPPQLTGTAKGVVWDLSVTTGPSDAGNQRIVDATITCSNGDQIVVRSGDAYWTFDLPPGTYDFTAEAPGYAPSTRTLQVTAGADEWGSIGLSPAELAVAVTVFVYDAAVGSSAPLEGAEVEITGMMFLTDSNGNLVVTLPPGPLLVRVRKEGFVAFEREYQVAGTAQTIEVGLAAETVTPPDEPGVPPEEPEVPPEQPEVPPEIPELPNEPGTPAQNPDDGRTALNPTGVHGGCGCSTPASHRDGPASVILLLSIAGLALIRRRR